LTEPQIAIVDYEAGNLRSVQKALALFGVEPIITSDPVRVRDADAIVVPGQGACDSAMKQMRNRGLADPIKEFIANGKPYFGMCMGLELLLDASDEGSEPCLGVVAGRTKKLPSGQKIPHMGWNEVHFKIDHPMFEGVADNSHFYFVHSYYAAPANDDVVAATTTYGVEFCSAAAWDNVVAVQFHPEKSGDVGLRVYRNFVEHVRADAKART
jgi:glutamine amidotransferase|tara:strand:+ start:3276 stop:3911 length:636 start_codon:yes stop_codon:yes gene_type:complete